MGYFLLFESMLDSVLYARDKYLKPDGVGKSCKFLHKQEHHLEHFISQIGQSSLQCQKLPKIFSSHLDNLNQNLGCPKKLFGCPIKPAKQACPPRQARWSLRPGSGGHSRPPQKLWGKWCKILHSGHILAYKSQLQIVGFFY